jgi:hypothetical protein
MDDDRVRRIRELAYRLWEEAGSPHGEAGRYWAEAERRVDAGEDEDVELAVMERQRKRQVDESEE